MTLDVFSPEVIDVHVLNGGIHLTTNLTLDGVDLSSPNDDRELHLSAGGIRGVDIDGKSWGLSPAGIDVNGASLLAPSSGSIATREWVSDTLNPVAFSGSASDLSSGTLPNARLSPQVVRSDFSYDNPSWITGVNWNKISNAPTTLAGYGITDAIPRFTAANNEVLRADGSAGNIKRSAIRITDTGQLELPYGVNHRSTDGHSRVLFNQNAGSIFIAPGVDGDHFDFRNNGNTGGSSSLFKLTNTQATFRDSLQIGGASGPRIKSLAGNVNLRSSGDVADAGISAGAATFSGVVRAAGSYSGTVADIPNLHIGSDGLLSRSTYDLAGALSGRVVGPASSATNQLARFADASGKVIKETPTTTIDGSGHLVHTGVASFQARVSLANEVWHNSLDSINRLFYALNGATYNRSGAASGTLHDFRSSDNVTRARVVGNADGGYLVPETGIQIGFTNGPRIKQSSGVFNFRNSADSTDAGLTAGAATFNGAMTGSGGAVFNASGSTMTASAVVEIISTNTTLTAGSRFKATSADGQYGCLTHYNSTASTDIGGKTVLESTVGIRISSERFIASGGTLPIEFSPGGRDMLSVTMPATGGLLINRGGGVEVTGYNTRTKLAGINHSTYSDITIFQHGWLLGATNYGSSILFNAKHPNETTHAVASRTDIPKRTSSLNTPIVWQNSLNRNTSFEVLSAPLGAVDTDIAYADWVSQFAVHRTTGDVTIGVGSLTLNNDVILSGDRRIRWGTTSLRVTPTNGELSVYGNGSSSNLAAGFRCRQLFIGANYSLAGNDEGLRVIGMATFTAGIQLGVLSTGVKLLNKEGVICARDVNDTVDIGLSGSTGTFSGSITANSGLSLISNSTSIAGAASQLNLTNTNTAAGAGVRVVLTSDDVVGYLSSYSLATTNGLNSRVLLSSTKNLRLSSSHNSVTGGAEDIEISPGGRNWISAVFPAAGGVNVLRGNLNVSAGYVSAGFQTLTADPTTLDLADGQSRLIRNSTSGEIRHWVNNAGIIVKSPAYT